MALMQLVDGPAVVADEGSGKKKPAKKASKATAAADEGKTVSAPRKKKAAAA
jgi:hypothetical protein